MTTSSTNYTGLYSGNVSSVIPNTAYGNANVVGLLAASTDGANTIGNISATGNVAGNYFLGNGSQLTGIAASYGNANVVTLLAAFGSNTVSTTGNVTAGNLHTPGQVSATGNIVGGNITTAGNVTGNYILGNGSQLTGIAASYGNANVVTLLGAFGSNTISTTGTVTAGNITGGNVLTGGVVSATGNITGNYILGNGSQLTGLPATYGNANVTTLLASFGSNTISTSGNITGGLFTGNGAGLTDIPGGNIVGGYGNANVATFLGSYGSNTLSTTGNVTTGNLNVQNDTVITGNLTVNGNTTLVNSNVVTINDKFINVANNAASAAQANGGGLGVGPVGTEYATLTYNSTNNDWNTSIALSVTGNVTGSNFVGNGQYLSSITGANVTGTVANATFATSAGTAGSANTAVTVTGNAQANITSVGTLSSLSVSGNTTTGNLLTGGVISATGNITGGNIIGTLVTSTISVSGNITGGNLLSNGVVSATANVSGGNLLSGGVVSATGNITGGNLITTGASGNILGADYVVANYFSGNGSLLTGISSANVTAAGSNTEIQYNNAGAFAGNVAMTFDNTSANVTLSNLIIGTSTSPSINAGNSATRLNTSNAYSGISAITNGFMPGQIVVGNGFFGNLNINNIQARPTGKFVVWDSANVVEASGNSIRYSAGAFTAQISISNIANSASFFRGGGQVLQVGGGPSANSYTATGQGMSAVVAGGAFLAVGQPNTVAALGNVTITGTSAGLAQNFTYAGSNVGNAAGFMSQISAAGNVTTGIGVQVNYAGTPATTPTNTFAYYMPGTTSTYGSTNSNGFRQATNYYFLRNDDAVAQNQLGSLRAYHTFQAAGTATGTWNIDKASGQVQAVSATGNITIGSYTNFVTTANDGTNNDSQSDTVTLIIEQGSTPYTVTMPTGNAAIRYANGVNTVTSSANTTTMIAVTAFRTAANATGYLTTISPAFS